MHLTERFERVRGMHFGFADGKPIDEKAAGPGYLHRFTCSICKQLKTGLSVDCETDPRIEICLYCATAIGRTANRATPAQAAAKLGVESAAAKA